MPPHVVLNRAKDRFPNTICEVVYEGLEGKLANKEQTDLDDAERIYHHKRSCHRWCDGKSDNIKDGDAWRKAQEIAYRLVNDYKHRGLTEGATHYHATYVNPKWAPTLDLVGRIGTHIFYRWP